MNKIVSFLYVSVIFKIISRVKILLPPPNPKNRSYGLDFYYQRENLFSYGDFLINSNLI